MATRTGDGRGGHDNSLFRVQAAGVIVLVFAVAAFLTSCASLNLDGETTDGDTTAEGGATDNGTIVQDGTTVEDTTVVEGATVMEETATMEETMMKESTTRGGETTAESTIRGGGITESTTKSSSTAGGSTPATGEAITDVRTIITEQDKQFLVGRRVRLREAGVRSVINDQSFLLGPSNARQVFAVLEGDQAQGAGVTAGETLSVDGEIKQLPSTEDARQRFGVTETEAALLQSQEIYLSVDKLEATQR